MNKFILHFQTILDLHQEQCNGIYLKENGMH